jgi:serine/threonine protein phosphatase 1
LGFERICLCGNHDDAFYKFIISPKLERDWLDFGGVATLHSYGVDVSFHLKIDPKGMSLLEAARDHIPHDHVAFLKNAPVALSVGKFIFVHAGIVPGHPLEDQDDSDLMWIREPFLTEGPQLDVIVVHGHTPTESIVFGKRRIGLDTGAYMTGRLNVLRINRDGYTVI